MLDGFLLFLLDKKQIHLLGELLADSSCTITCFGAVIEYQKHLAIYIVPAWWRLGTRCIIQNGR